MRYYLDCEFNGMGGELLSLALVPEHGHAIYLINTDMEVEPRETVDPWVAQNVMPILRFIPDDLQSFWVGKAHFADCLEDYLKGDTDVTIITDWPDDIKYFCELIITGPGTMIEVRPSIKFEMHRVDAYPTTLPGAVQHNAYWDAMALRHKLTQEPA